MIRKTVEFSTPGTRLSVSHRQLVIERPDHPRATLPIEDLGVIIVGEIRFMVITDKQFARTRIYVGKTHQQTPPPPAQLEFF